MHWLQLCYLIGSCLCFLFVFCVSCMAGNRLRQEQEDEWYAEIILGVLMGVIAAVVWPGVLVIFILIMGGSALGGWLNKLLD